METNNYQIRVADVVKSKKYQGFLIEVVETPSLPSDVQEKIDDNWKKFSEKKQSRGEKVNDGRVLFLSDCLRRDGLISGHVFIDGFSKAAYLNRAKEAEPDFDRIVSRDINFGVPFTTWGVPITSDGKAVFNYKVGAEYQTKAASSFGGISNESDLSNGFD